MRIRTIRGRIVLAIFLVGCIPLFIGLLLASVSGMRSLRNVIGGNFQAIAVQAADRVTMLVEAQVQALDCWPPLRFACASLCPSRICPIRFTPRSPKSFANVAVCGSRAPIFPRGY